MDDSHNISQTKKVDGPCGRCVGRSNNNANANGGLVYANANNASSNSNSNNGSRLANSKIFKNFTISLLRHTDTSYRIAEGEKSEPQ